MTKYIIVLPNGTEIGSGADSENAIASTTLTTATNSGTDLTLGSVCAAMVESTLITPGAGVAITAGDEITLYTEDETGARTKIGLFSVERPSHPSANRTKLTAYDRVTRLDKDLTAWLNGLTGYPYTLKNFAHMVCEECGVSLKTQDIPNGDFSITTKPTSATVTGRQLMQWLAEIAGKFVTANADGELEFGWYVDSGITIEPDGENYYFGGSLSYEEYNVAQVDAVKVRLADGENGALWPAGEAVNPYITSNKLLQIRGTDVNDTVLAPMLTAAALSYTPCKVSVQVASGIKAGQIITITDSNGTVIRTPVMEAVQSGQKIAIQSTGAANRSSAENLNSPDMQETAENVVAGQTQADIFNKLTNGGKAEGIYIEDGKIYINASYIQIGELLADLIKAGKITSSDSSGGYFVVDLDKGEIKATANEPDDFGTQLETTISNGRVVIEDKRTGKRFHEFSSEHGSPEYKQTVFGFNSEGEYGEYSLRVQTSNAASIQYGRKTEETTPDGFPVYEDIFRVFAFNDGHVSIDGLSDFAEDDPQYEKYATPKSYVDRQKQAVDDRIDEFIDEANTLYAPEGYGLGKTSAPTKSSISTASPAGFFRTTSATEDLTQNTHNVGIVMPYSENEVAQLLVRTLNGTLRVRRLYNAEWYEEWVNPPMAHKPYKTLDPVRNTIVSVARVAYTFTEDFGSETGNADYGVPHGIEGFVRLVRCNATDGGSYPLPYFSAGGGFIVVKSVDSTGVNLRTYKATMSARTLYFDLFFTKD